MKSWKVIILLSEVSGINAKLGKILQIKKCLETYGFQIYSPYKASSRFKITGTSEQLFEFKLLEDVSKFCEIYEISS
jgi:hypothetical protein